MEGKKDGNETNMYFYSRPCGRGDPEWAWP